MGRTFFVKIRSDLLRSNLSAADGADYTRADVRRRLRDAGFEPVRAGWRVDEANLLLEPAEVSEATPECEGGARQCRARVA